MKFVLRILIYLAVTIVNFAIYVFLFMTMAGLSPQRSLDMLKAKAAEVAADTVSIEAVKAKESQMLTEYSRRMPIKSRLSCSP